ncbi:hypothetical protein SCHPADRAFT_911356 [Schizopora paradoxa]|uniref:F-box domain-containing protein n=1 Tax=Schizopora paradoxa TaxID=27342 RepID=A0A0H2QZM2_9AGAM|nr:hypothetical protein SCHPADRAFT_911356 [Schizopora paradoxa]
MTTVNDLPNEILCDIFSLAIQKSRVFPEIFKTGNDFQDCVALIDISCVCSRWREVALTDSSLWSSIYILLDDPTAETLVQVTYFASICFVRSKDLPLIFAISISNLDDLPFAYPLVQTLISHEARWSRIAVNLTPSRYSRSSEASLSYKRGTEYIPELRIAGGELLKEFRCNLGSWLTYSLHSPLPALSTLSLTCCRFYGSMYALTNWLPLAPNLQELELTYSYNRFDAHTAWLNKQRVWKAAATEATKDPHFVLPSLRTLNAWVNIIVTFTCPALERLVMEEISWHGPHLINYLEFVKRSGTPPSFRTMEIREQDDPSHITHARGFLLPTITNLLITSPGAPFFTMFSEQTQEDGVAGFSVLPALEHLEITDCRDDYLPHFSSLVTSRWDIGVLYRTLKTVKLKQCFEASPVPELLLSPPSDGIDLTQVGENWRGIARCVNEGLSLSACE